jgi:hypothetical protein
MNITEEEAKTLANLAGHASKAMEEAGAHCVLVLWTRKVGDEWLLEWSRQGSPYEAVALAARYGVIDAQQAQALAIGQAINPPDDGSAWKAD